jgi:hypothetical protein
MSIIVRLLINLSFNDIKPLIKAIYQPYRDSHDSYYELPVIAGGNRKYSQKTTDDRR